VPAAVVGSAVSCWYLCSRTCPLTRAVASKGAESLKQQSCSIDNRCSQQCCPGFGSRTSSCVITTYANLTIGWLGSSMLPDGPLAILMQGQQQHAMCFRHCCSSNAARLGEHYRSIQEAVCLSHHAVGPHEHASHSIVS
jgi:hypothetical protein